MPFEKGKSGNPGGRPKKSSQAAYLARKYAEQAIEALVGNLKDENGSVRNSAARELLDRGFGKPEQYVELDADQKHTIRELPETDDWLSQFVGAGKKKTSKKAGKN